MNETNIDWARFSQGPLSDDMWKAFKALVRNSHDYVKHKAEADEARRMARVPDPSAHNRRRHERGWEKSTLSHDNEWHNAGFWAHKALNQIAAIGRDHGSESPDRRFSDAITAAVGPLRDQTRCDFYLTAINRMDAGAFLQVPANQIMVRLRSLAARLKDS